MDMLLVFLASIGALTAIGLLVVLVVHLVEYVCGRIEQVRYENLRRGFLADLSDVARYCCPYHRGAANLADFLYAEWGRGVSVNGGRALEYLNHLDNENQSIQHVGEGDG